KEDELHERNQEEKPSVWSHAIADHRCTEEDRRSFERVTEVHRAYWCHRQTIVIPPGAQPGDGQENQGDKPSHYQGPPRARCGGVSAVSSSRAAPLTLPSSPEARQRRGEGSRARSAW